MTSLNLPRAPLAAVVVSAALLLQSPVVTLANARSQFLPLVPGWSVALSAPPGAPPVMAGTTVVMPLQSHIVAFNLANGIEAWHVELSPVLPLSVDADHVYVPAEDGVHAIGVASGKVVWRADTGPLTAPILVRSGWLIAASAGGSVSAIRVSDGATVWRQSVGPVQYRPAIDGDLLVVPSAEESLLGLDLQTGAERWEQPLGGAPGEPFAVGGKVYAGASDKHFYSLNASNGRIDWQLRVGAAPRGQASADDDHLYFVSLDNVLRALDRGSGNLKWHKNLKYRPASGPVLIRGALLVPGAAMTLPVFGPDGTSLHEIKLASTLAAVSDVAVDGSRLPSVAIVTGDLQHPWTLVLLVASTDPPALPLQPLTTLPGALVPIALPN